MRGVKRMNVLYSKSITQRRKDTELCLEEKQVTGFLSLSLCASA